MFKFIKKPLVGLGALALGATTANAALDVSGVTLDVSQVEVIGLTIMTALGLIWVVKKVLSVLE